MPSFTHVLAPVDLSERSRHTAVHADEMARLHGAELTLLHVHPGFERVRAASERAAILVALQELANGLMRPRPARLAIEEGATTTEVVAYAAGHGVDLIVVGAHCRRGLERLLPLETCAEAIADRAPCSVLVIPEAAEEARRAPTIGSKIICTVGFDASATQTVNRAISLADAVKARLTLLHVSRGMGQGAVDDARQQLNALLARQPAAYPSVDTMVTQGRVAEEISRVALLEKACLLVVGTHTTRPFWRTGLGRIGRRLLEAPPCPILLARPGPVTEPARHLAPSPELALHE